MVDALTASSVRFDALTGRPPDVLFDQPCTSSGGGAVLSKAVDERLGLTARIASQPSLCGFENALDGRSIVRMGHALADTVIARQKDRRAGRARRTTIDLDPTGRSHPRDPAGQRPVER